MDFVPDYDLAKKQVHKDRFDTYTCAYVVTNEELRKSMCFVPENCENALVVAASGDHPLFCSLYGAKHVDTFDVSYNAKCMMDIKVVALKSLGYFDYRQFLGDLYTECRSSSINITNVKNMDKILQMLPQTEADYIRTLNEEPLFSRGPSPTSMDAVPTFAEYCALRKKITKPYDFFLTNIYKLEKHLNKSYDFVHLSNIFDYVIENDYEELLLSIMKCVKPGGRVVTESFEEDSYFHLDFIGPKIVAISGNNFVFKKLWRTYILERIR